MTRQEPPAGAGAAMFAAAQERAVLDPRWAEAFAAVPRHRFLPARVWLPGPEGGPHYLPVDRETDPEGWWGAAYGPDPVVTQVDDGRAEPPGGPGMAATSSVSAPDIVLAMLYDLDLREGHRVLEIGTGPGWNAGLLTHRLGGERVTTLEVDPVIADTARANLAALGLHPEVVAGDGRRGHPPGAPYDRIIATAALGGIPYAWIEQSRPGTVIVAPWRAPHDFQAIARLTVGPDLVASGRFTGGAAFMPVRAERIRPIKHEERVPTPFPDTVRASRTALDPGALLGYRQHALAFALGLVVPAFQYAPARGPSGVALWLYATDDDSWAYAYRPDDDTEAQVYQHGPRSLWDETEDAYRWWLGAGCPGVRRFGLTVAEDGQRVWLDRADYPVSGAGGAGLSGPGSCAA
jgi:protein-L-isoaspartate O-methyltransferase